MKNNKTITATLAALFAQIIFGFSFMFTKISLGFSSPFVVIADRYIVAFSGLTLVMIFTGQKFKIGKNIRKLIIMSVFQPLLYFIFESYGIALTTSAFSSVMIALIPVVAMICGIFVLNEKPSPFQYLFTVLSVAGVAIMALAGNKDGTVTPLGIILLAGAVVSSAAYNMISRKISAEFSVFERTYAMTAIGLASFLSIALIENISQPAKIVSSFTESSYLLSILYLGIVSSVFAFLLLNYANTHLPVAKTTVFSNLTTVVSVIAGTFFLNEKLSGISVLGVLMIITGVFGVQMLSVKNVQKNQS
ncbi:MAG: DMT family transporter [Clostridia bacterium]|nr:DMT family transporter [Clostridia bacterium]